MLVNKNNDKYNLYVDQVMRVAEYFKTNEPNFIVGEWVRSKEDVEIDGVIFYEDDLALITMQYKEEVMGVPVNDYWIGLRPVSNPSYIAFTMDIDDYFESTDKKPAGIHYGNNGQRVFVIGEVKKIKRH